MGLTMPHQRPPPTNANVVAVCLAVAILVFASAVLLCELVTGGRGVLP